jgi:hypothetical protein
MGEPKDTQTCIVAAPDARWERFTPFESYRPTTRVRMVEAGPHLAFLRLKDFWEDDSALLRTAYQVFATRYGLLGVFEEEYYWPPALPSGKKFVAPEAIIDSQGKLRRIDPATEGNWLLWNAVKDSGRIGETLMPLELNYASIALPSEIEFTPKGPFIDSFFRPAMPHHHPVSWEVIKEVFGVLLILDEKSDIGVSVLWTREPLQRWNYSVVHFPSGDMPVEWLLTNHYDGLNWHLRQISPYALLGEDGNLKRGWHYRSLLQAMYVMLWLDLTGDNTIKYCMSRGCPNYFRMGSQNKSKYCSERCANRASTRIRRGQVP